jgi:hypothetical protein
VHLLLPSHHLLLHLQKAFITEPDDLHLKRTPSKEEEVDKEKTYTTGSKNKNDEHCSPKAVSCFFRPHLYCAPN